MAEQKKPEGSPTRKTIAPTPNVNNGTPTVESTMAALSQRIKAQSKDSANGVETQKQIVKDLQTNLTKIIENLKSDDKVVRRQNLHALKETRMALSELQEGVLKDKDLVIKGVDAVIKASSVQTGTLARIGNQFSESLDNVVKKLPTVKTFTSAFIKDSNPLFKVAYDMVGEFGGLLKGGDPKEKSAQDKAIEAQAKQLKQLKAVEDKGTQQVEATKEVVKEQKQIRRQSSRKGEGPVVKRLETLASSTDVQTRLLTAIYEDLSGKKFDVQELIRQDAEMLKEFVEGIKDGINEEAKATGADPELVKGLIDGINQEAAPLIKAMEDQKAAIEKTTDAVKQQTEVVKDSEADRKNKEFKARKKKEPVAEVKSGGQFKKEKGFFENMINGFAQGVMGLVQSLGGGLAKAGSAMAKVGAIATKALGILKLVGRLSGVFTVVLSVFDFMNGFTNADKILGKVKGALGLWDKVSAGIGMVVEGFASLFDWLGGFLGFQTGWSKDISKKVAGFLVDFGDGFMNFFTGVWNDLEGAVTIFKNVMSEYTDPEYWKKKAKSAFDVFSNIADVILDGIKALVRAHLSFIPKAMMPAWLEKALEPSSGSSSAPAAASKPEPGAAVAEDASKPVGALLQPITRKADSMKDYHRTERELAAQESKKAAAPASIVAPSTNTVNANTSNYYPSPLQTRNDDQTIRMVNRR